MANGNEQASNPNPTNPSAAWPAWKRKKHQAMEMRAVLLKRFPACFKPFGELKAPFKVGIRDDVCSAAPELDQSMVHCAIRDYASGRTYHQAASVAGTLRIDLQGNPCGAITEDQAKFHARHLARITARQARRQAAKAGTGAGTGAPT